MTDLSVLDVVIKVAFPFLAGISGWTLTMLRDHDQRIRTLEASSQTKEAAALDLSRVYLSLNKIEVALARIEERLRHEDK